MSWSPELDACEGATHTSLITATPPPSLSSRQLPASEDPADYVEAGVSEAKPVPSKSAKREAKTLRCRVGHAAEPEEPRSRQLRQKITLDRLSELLPLEDVAVGHATRVGRAGHVKVRGAG